VDGTGGSRAERKERGSFFFSGGGRSTAATPRAEAAQDGQHQQGHQQHRRGNDNLLQMILEPIERFGAEVAASDVVRVDQVVGPVVRSFTRAAVGAVVGQHWARQHIAHVDGSQRLR